MAFKKILEKKAIRLVIGLTGLLGGTIVLIIDWGKGDGSFSGGNLSFYAFVLSGIGAYYLLNLKFNDFIISSAYAFLYPLILGLFLYGYSYLYLFPRIEKQGKTTKAEIIEVGKKLSGNMNLHRGVYYRYFVNNKEYIKYEFSKNLKVGDTIRIKYYELNPNFHLNSIEE